MPERLRIGTPVEEAAVTPEREHRGVAVGDLPINPASEPEGEVKPFIHMNKAGGRQYLKGDSPGVPVESALERLGTHGGQDKGPFGRLALDPRKLADVGQLGGYILTHPLEALERAGKFTAGAVREVAERPQKAAAEYEPGVYDEESGKKVAAEAFKSGPGLLSTVGTLRAATQGARAAEVGASGADLFSRSYVKKMAEKIRAEERGKGLTEQEVRERTVARLNEQFIGELDEGTAFTERMIRNLPEPVPRGTPRDVVKFNEVPQTMRNAFVRARDDVVNAVDKVYRAQSTYRATADPIKRRGAADRVREAERHLEAYKNQYKRTIETIVNQMGTWRNFQGPNAFRDMEIAVNRLIPRDTKIGQLGTGRGRTPKDEGGGELGAGGGRPSGPPKLNVVETNVPHLRDAIQRSEDALRRVQATLKELKQQSSIQPGNQPLKDTIQRLETNLAQNRLLHRQAVEHIKAVSELRSAVESAEDALHPYQMQRDIQEMEPELERLRRMQEADPTDADVGDRIGNLQQDLENTRMNLESRVKDMTPDQKALLGPQVPNSVVQELTRIRAHMQRRQEMIDFVDNTPYLRQNQTALSGQRHDRAVLEDLRERERQLLSDIRAHHERQTPEYQEQRELMRNLDDDMGREPPEFPDFELEASGIPNPGNTPTGQPDDWTDRNVTPLMHDYSHLPEMPNIQLDAGSGQDVIDANRFGPAQSDKAAQPDISGAYAAEKIKGEAGEDRLEEPQRYDWFRKEEGGPLEIDITLTPRIGARERGPAEVESIDSLIEPAALKEKQLKDRGLKDRQRPGEPLPAPSRDIRGTPVPVTPEDASPAPAQPEKDLLEDSKLPPQVKGALREVAAPIGIYTETARRNAEELWHSVNEFYNAKTVGGHAWAALKILGSSYAYAYTPIEALGAWALGRPFETATGLKGSQKFIGQATSMAVQMAPGQTIGRLMPQYSQAPNIIGQASAVTKAVRESRPGQELKGIFAPTTTEPVTYVKGNRLHTTSAARMARSIMPWSAALARTTAQAERSVRQFKGTIARMDRNQRFQFMDMIEQGNIAGMPAEWQPLAQALRDLMDNRVAMMQTLRSQSTGRHYLQNPIPNYFPHIWEVRDPQTMQVINNLQRELISAAARRPLKGSGAFLMPRTIHSIQAGMARGLKLVSDDPIELTMIKLREMDKFYFGTKMAQELRKSNIIKAVRNHERVPHGWEQVGARMGGQDPAFLIRTKARGAKNYTVSGAYWAPAPVARVMNNYLSKRLHGHSSIYDGFRYTGNAMNSLQLSLSLFHAVFTTLDVSISTSAMGVQQLSRGEKLRGAFNMLYGAVPLVPTAMNLYRGHKLYNAYFDTLGATPAYQQMVRSLIQAGGRANMDNFYRIGKQQFLGGFRASQSGPRFTDRFRYHPIVDTVRREFRDHPYWAIMKAPAHLASGVLNDLAWPIMEWLVPRQKLGVFHMMYGDWVRRNPAATVDQTRAAMQQIWTSIDNRLGQMVYDNLFWHNVHKDLAFLTVRSVGWNLGTIREIGGGAADAMSMFRQLNEGQKLQLTERMAYTIMLPVITGLYGATLHYLMTGEPPKQPLDYIAPRTGNKTAQGGDERLPIPSYMKDLYSINEDWTHLGNKLHPFWALSRELITDKNYWGGLIYDPRDPAADQIKDQFDHAMGAQLPFSYQSYQRMAKEGRTWEAYLSFLGLQLAPGYMTDPDKEAKDEHKLDRLRRQRDRFRIRHEQ